MESESEFLSGYYVVNFNNVDFYIRFLNSPNDLLENESIASSNYSTYEEAEKVIDYIGDSFENIKSVGGCGDQGCAYKCKYNFDPNVNAWVWTSVSNHCGAGCKCPPDLGQCNQFFPESYYRYARCESTTSTDPPQLLICDGELPSPGQCVSVCSYGVVLGNAYCFISGPRECYSYLNSNLNNCPACGGSNNESQLGRICVF